MNVVMKPCGHVYSCVVLRFVCACSAAAAAACTTQTHIFITSVNTYHTIHVLGVRHIGLNAAGTRCLRVHTSGQYISSITLPVPLSTTDASNGTAGDLEQGNGVIHSSGGCSSGTRSRRVSSGEKSSIRLFM
jgi:hypothetical protein